MQHLLTHSLIVSNSDSLYFCDNVKYKLGCRFVVDFSLIYIDWFMVFSATFNNIAFIPWLY